MGYIRNWYNSRTTYKEIKRTISSKDLMYKAAPEHYFTWGEKALERVQLTMKEVGKTNVNRILDLPSGYGRELRFFKNAFPNAEITACEIDRKAVDFCVKTFGVTGVYSEKDASLIPLEEKFDLIWCGSLLTHLAIPDWERFLRFFSNRLEKNGILIFTTHGPQIIEDFRKGVLNLVLEGESSRRILREHDTTGFGYCNYTGQNGFGVSLSSPDWVCHFLEKFPELQLIEYVERGWYNYQDTVACIRK